eukprot:sb/3478795/
MVSELYPASTAIINWTSTPPPAGAAAVDFLTYAVELSKKRYRRHTTEDTDPEMRQIMMQKRATEDKQFWMSKLEVLKKSEDEQTIMELINILAQTKNE